jgi:hypothetical protein
MQSLGLAICLLAISFLSGFYGLWIIFSRNPESVIKSLIATGLSTVALVVVCLITS